MSDRRRATLSALGGSAAAAEELLAYDDLIFEHPDPLPDLPLEDEAHIEAWSAWADRATLDGAEAVLRRVLVQLDFEIEAGMSEDEAYRRATRRGLRPAPGERQPLTFERPEDLRLEVHQSAAGRLPVLTARHRPDFEALVRAVALRNEPEPVPPSMGACLVSGYNNWARVDRYRARWAERAADPSDEAWRAVWRERVRPDKSLYQDRVMILSRGPYSGVAAETLGLEEEAWLDQAQAIRLEHECTHYLTRRALGTMRKRALDEVLCDYAGIVAARGRFEPTWLLTFLGLEDASRYRRGARLENYADELSPEAFDLLCRVTAAATRTLTEVDRGLGPEHRDVTGRARVVIALARFTLTDLAAEGAADRVRAALA